MKSRIVLLVAFFSSFCTIAQTDKAPLVTTESLDKLAFYPVKSAPAKVMPLNHSNLPARVGGIIDKLLVRVGDQVQKGDTLASLDCQDHRLALQQLQAELAQAQAQLNFRQRDLKRAQTLAEKETLSEFELDRKKTDVTAALAQNRALEVRHKQAKLNIDRCTISAPFAGQITARLVNEGEQVNPGQPIISLLQTGQQEISAQIALVDKAGFENAKSYHLEVGDEQYPLTLRRMVPLVYDNSRSIESRLEFGSKTTFSGVTGRVKWQSPTRHLPGYLLQKRDGQYGFFVLVQDKAKFITVEDAGEGRPIKIPQAQNHQVILDGRFGLSNETRVQLNNK